MQRQKELGWGRKAVERLAVDRQLQIEALRQIGIDVALYQELERKAALQAEIRRATLQQEQSSEGKYFRYMKPGKQVTPKERDLRNKIAALLPVVREQRQCVADLEDKISTCKEEIESNWSETNKTVHACLDEDERLERNGPHLASNGKKSVSMERISLETIKARIAQDISLLKSEIAELDKKISGQKTHVEYIRNYERLGLPRDLRKIDQLENELRRLKMQDLSKGDFVENAPEVEDLKQELAEHVSLMGGYYAKKALKNRVPDGLLQLVHTNTALYRERDLLQDEIESLKVEINNVNDELCKLPTRIKSAVVKSTLYPEFSCDKIFPRSKTSISIELPALVSAIS